jgi:hypothetical protein
MKFNIFSIKNNKLLVYWPIIPPYGRDRGVDKARNATAIKVGVLAQCIYFADNFLIVVGLTSGCFLSNNLL